MAKIDLLLQGFSLASDQGSFGFCGVTLVEGTKRILVDVAHVGRRSLVLQKLQERGLTPNDIDYVFLTHAHWDHMLNIDLFPNARVLIHPREREYVKQPHAADYATPGYVTSILESHRLQEVKDGEEIDDGISVLPTPGHSKGSMALLVRDDSGVAAVCGDALPNSWSVRSGVPRLVFWDLDEAKASIGRLLQSATSFYPGHDRPFAVDAARNTRYLQPTSVRIFGWPDQDPGEGGPGLGFASEPERQANLVLPPR
jgi:N-acyl homoserine lactone hydrolase